LCKEGFLTVLFYRRIFGSLNKMYKNRMGSFYGTLQFRMILHTYKKRMIDQFYNFLPKLLSGFFATGNHALSFVLTKVSIVNSSGGDGVR